MKNFDLENIKSHPSLSLAKAKASRDLQINFNQAEDALTISTKSRGDNKYGSATQSGRSLLPESGADAPTVLSAVYTDSTPAKNRQADVPQYGRSMIEMLGVLAIIGVLSVGGIAGYSKAMQKYRINKAIEQITIIAGNVRSFFAPQHNYDGLGRCYNDNDYCKLIKKAKLMPDEMWDDTDKQFNNVFGYRVDLDTTNKSKSGDKQAFSIDYRVGDNLEACIELLSQDWSATNVGFISVGDGGPGVSVTYLKNLPANIDTAVTACSNAIAGGKRYSSTPTIQFYFDVNLNGDAYKNYTWAN